MGRWDQAIFLTVLGSPVVMWAAWTTIWVATVAQTIGTLIGLGVAPMMMAKARAPRFIAFVYLWIFRGTPLLAQILFFYAVLPQLGLRLSIVATGLVALGVNEGARMAEIVRSGLLSVGREQREAAASLGLKRAQIFFLVTLPQAMRAILPPLGNNYSYMIKATSLLSVISFAELLRTSQQLAQSTVRPLEVYSAAAIYYLVIISVVTLAQRALERRLSRGRGAREKEAARARRAFSPPPLPPPVHRELVVEARGLTKRLGEIVALNGVDLAVRQGEVVVVIGASGSGKSTLLRCLNHLTQPDAGVVLIEGDPLGWASGANGTLRPLPERAIDRQRRRIGMVFQRFHLFANLTAADNVSLGMRRLERSSREEARARSVALLTRFGLAEKADAKPFELSGGQQQRVAIARALATSPILLLFDEPTSALDPETVNDVLAAMRDLAAEGRTMIIVTHEMGFARAVADRIVVMDEGRIIESGAPADVLDRPSDPRTRALLARM